MKTPLFFASLFLLLFMGQVAFGHVGEQNPQVHRIETSDGNIYSGILVSELNKVIVLRTEDLGEIIIQESDVKRKTRLEKPREGNEQSNLHGNRYFILSNSLGIPRNSGYYQNTWVFFNQVHYGLHNNISIGAGIVPLFLFAGAPTPMWLVPTITIPISKDNFALGANALIGTIVKSEGGNVAGVVNFTGTVGNHNNNFTLGLGYGYIGKYWAKSPVVSFSGIIRTGKKHHLMTENYFISVAEEFNLLSLFGGRFNFSGIALDYGLLLPLFQDLDSFVALPWLGVAVPF